MNARQKAKYYKRKYEELAVQFVPNVTEVHHRIVTIKVSRNVPTYLITEESVLHIKKALLRDIADSLDAYVSYGNAFFLYNDGRYCQYTAKLDVVEKCDY